MYDVGTDEDNKKNKFDYKNLMNNSYVLDYKGVKQPLYEPDRYSDEYIKAYAVWNNRKKAKQKLCQDIKKEMDRRNTDSRDITAKFEVFHYHCIREIKDIFTKNGEFNINLAVNSIIDMEYNKNEFKTSTKDMLWKCFGHVIVDNLNQNQKTGIVIKERARMCYKKAVEGDDTLDNILENKLSRKSVNITQADKTFMDAVLQKKKNGTYYQNDRELLFSLMLESHNDTAVVLGEYIGGKLLGETGEISEHTGEESKAALHRFAQAMNEKAEEIGCEDTWFITPNGLDATETLTLSDGSTLEREHHTTAKDLAEILRYCMKSSPQRDLFLEITGTQDYSFTENGRFFQCHNHNAFLQMMDGAFTGKTGFTNKAGYCYVGALKRDGKCLIVALLACGWPNLKTYKWSDSRELFTYGLENFTYRSFEEETFSGREQLLMPIPVLRAQNDALTEEVLLPVEPDPETEGVEGLLMGPDENVEILYRKEQYLTAPVEAGECVGEISYLVDGRVWRRERLIAAKDVEAIDFVWCGRQILWRFLVRSP